MRTLFVAAGGGGDAVGILLARRVLDPDGDGPALISTCAWERLRVDPTPGPRPIHGFTGLGTMAGHDVEVLPTSKTDPPGRSMLPRLAREADARLFLHDFEGGAQGLAEQLRHTANSLSADRTVVVDVGGDVIATGPEANLLSPLADSVTLAAALSLDMATTLAVIGPGTDAELTEGEVLERLAALGARLRGCVTPADVQRCAGLLDWHPTEASALVAASARGVRGAVEMRRGMNPTPLTGHGREVWLVPFPKIEEFPIAKATTETLSLAEAEHAVARLAVNELNYERSRAVALSDRKASPPRSIQSVLTEARTKGATHITRRRLLEQLDSSSEATHELGPVLQAKQRGGLWDISQILTSTT